ncbi:MAG: calcium/proton exchanger [Actinobacteria bacterium 13_1_20CM_3_68_9]|nr:MAG: calcium/proton exchanger [Actinobacteria bacterium 13_1_20CM_3_68_9]
MQARLRWLRPSINWLLAFIPVSLAVEIAHQPLLVFVTSGVAIIPLAGLIGRATDQLAMHVGPRLGGLLNATFGNLTELIVAVLLIGAGDFEIVKASLIGSIVGNLLLVLGLSLFVGGLRRGEQAFSARAAGVHTGSLVLAVAGLGVPALLVATSPTLSTGDREIVSAGVAATLIVLYASALVFTQISSAHLFRTPESSEHPEWSRALAIGVLLGAAVLVGLESELLVSALNPALETLKISPVFVGLILIPVIGNAAEHASAVFFAIRNKVDVTLEIAVGSSTQVALFVAPAMVFISLLIGRPMDFVFTGFEIGAVFIATLIIAVISRDGHSNWLEGLQLIGVYAIIALAAFFL